VDLEPENIKRKKPVLCVMWIIDICYFENCAGAAFMLLNKLIEYYAVGNSLTLLVGW